MKLIDCVGVTGKASSRPARGAWIEMAATTWEQFRAAVAPRKGRVD